MSMPRRVLRVDVGRARPPRGRLAGGGFVRRKHECGQVMGMQWGCDGEHDMDNKEDVDSLGRLFAW